MTDTTTTAMTITLRPAGLILIGTVLILLVMAQVLVIRHAMSLSRQIEQLDKKLLRMHQDQMGQLTAINQLANRFKLHLVVSEDEQLVPIRPVQDEADVGVETDTESRPQPVIIP